MSAPEYLKGLPSVNRSNFSRFKADSCKTSSKKPSVYLATKDFPSEQIIRTETSSLLVRYLHRVGKNAKGFKKRDSNQNGSDGDCSCSRKKVKTTNEN